MTLFKRLLFTSYGHSFDRRCRTDSVRISAKKVVTILRKTHTRNCTYPINGLYLNLQNNLRTEFRENTKCPYQNYRAQKKSSGKFAAVHICP